MFRPLYTEDSEVIRKKLLSLSLAACLALAPASVMPKGSAQGFAISAHAQETQGLEYTELTPSTVAVTGYTGEESALVIPSKIDEKNVAAIADSAFAYSESLESIELPGTVKTIGEKAFSHCYKLKEIKLPGSVTAVGQSAFESCISLTKAELSQSVTSIGHSAFKNCVSLSSVKLPGELTQLSDSTFENCPGLTSVTLPSKLKTIGRYAFSQCSALAQITLPSTVTSVGEYAFYKCSNLAKAELPKSVTSLGLGAFMFCEKLEKVSIPTSVKTISNYLFAGCTSLVSADLPDTATSVGYSAFLNCSSLDHIAVPDSAVSVSGRAFEGCTSLRVAYIPKGVKSIGERAFENCTTLESIEIPGTVTRIYPWAFSGCTKLGSVTVGSAVSSIGSYAFYNCPSLKSITLPETVKTIEPNALGFCYDRGLKKTEDFTVRCFRDSSAHSYALENEFAFELIVPDLPTRIYGATRFETALKIADSIKAANKGQPFKNIIIASGMNYADALSASYLASVKDAPILITSASDSVMDSVEDYIRKNADKDCRIYIIGGESAVPEKMQTRLSGFSVSRIFGKNRYSTNIEVLKAAGVSDEEILVASGADYADALSASAVGKPILLVPGKSASLTSEQTQYLSRLAKANSAALSKAYIIGGTGAVSEGIEKQLSGIFKHTQRVFGKNRFDTSAQVANTFFENTSPGGIVIAYGLNYPDGLCGGPLALKYNRPLLLVTDSSTASAEAFVKSIDVSNVLALGGKTLISDSTVSRISNAKNSV